MKLATCVFEKREFAGAVFGEHVYPLAGDMTDFIRLLNGALPGKELLEGIEPLPLSRVKLLAPIPRPGQDIICLGMNYADHEKESSAAGVDRHKGKAEYFAKRAFEIIGAGAEIDGHFDCDEHLDYEVELAVVLSKDAYHVAYEDAFAYVLGYSVFNDVSARTLQLERNQWYFGKSLETFAVMGPWIVTRDELPSPPEISLRCFVNGEKRQESNTRLMLFDIPFIISELSKGMVLRAGSIIATGTPSGVALGMKPQAWLKSGDVVRCEIDGVGAIENPVK